VQAPEFQRSRGLPGQGAAYFSGKAVTEIAAALGLSVKTVSTYWKRLLEKMSLKTNTELIHYALRPDLLP
jgi:DNA-binding NarL/FixJ family response regulator